MSPPKQKPHRSAQDVCTPREFLDAVVARFGRIEWDYACSVSDCVGDARLGFMHDLGVDALAEEWTGVHGDLGWLNPPFGNIAPFAKKAAGAANENPRWRLAMLVPASVGSNWYRNYVHGKAYVLFLQPRLTFVGHTHCFPKDLMLAVYQNGIHGTDVWNWRHEKVRETAPGLREFLRR